MTIDDAQRERGKALMKQVYGWDVDHVEGPFVEYTVDHLFANVWNEGKLTVKERRLMLIGLAAGSGLEDVAGLQLDAAVRLGELDAEDLRTIAARLNTEVENIIARTAKAAARAAAADEGDDLP
jgi:4-carboxymuconolactone decarboxylase